MLHFADLRAFARVADLQSVSAAARSLRAPKSSVSRSLARLEAAVGAALVERSSRRLRLTDAGALLRSHALRILGDVEEAEAALGNLAASPRGTLRVSAPFAFAAAQLGPMLPDFMALHPQVRVVLDVDNRHVDLLAREVDVAIRFGPLADSELVARRLPSVAIWLCASPSYLAARGSPGRVADLAHHDLVARVDGRQTWAFETPGAGREQVSLTARLVVPDPMIALAMLERGAGIGQLPAFVATDALARGSLVRVLPDAAMPLVDAHALYPSHRGLSAKVRVFVDALVAHLASLGSPPGAPRSTAPASPRRAASPRRGRG
ncbi:LysR family transcriptional regulator [Sorangium sp. So ce269]